jgi:hypothetical protein
MKQKFLKVYLGNLILKYDGIHDAFKVICNKNLKRNSGDIGTETILANNREILY